MCNLCRSLTELRELTARAQNPLDAEEQRELWEGLTKNIEHFEAAKNGDPIPEWDGETDNRNEGPEIQVMGGDDAREFLDKMFGRKPETPKVPTLTDVEQGANTQREFMRPLLSNAGFVRETLITEGFSEMAAEQVAGNFFLTILGAGAR